LPEYFYNLYTCPNITDLVDKFHVKNCLNYVIRLAATEHILMSRIKVFTRNFDLNWQIECRNNFRFARIYSRCVIVYVEGGGACYYPAPSVEWDPSISK